MSRKSFNPRIRFSLRSLIALFLFAGIAFSAFHYRLADAHRQAATVARLQAFGGCVRYRNHHDVMTAPKQANFVSGWLHSQLGLDFFHDVETVCISGRGEFSDDDFAGVCALRNIRSVRLGKTAVTDQGLEPLARLGGLRNLSIGSPHITDRGIAHLSQLHQLETLTLVDMHLTDAGLATLATLGNLERLSIRQTRVSRTGVERLRAALTQCHIQYYPSRY